MKIKLSIIVIVTLVSSILLWINLSKPNLIKTLSSMPMNKEVNQIASIESRINQDTHYKKLLFVDQSLEELVTQYSSRDTLLSEPFKHLRDGDPEAAKKSLKQILVNPVAEIRHKLWAWKALRQLGDTPPSNIRDEVHGVVFEIPINDWVDTLAVYSDGRIRYLNGKLGVSELVVWEDTENPHFKPLVMRVIDSAQALVGKTLVVDRHKEGNPAVEPRISVLTYRGLYIFDRDGNNSYLIDPVLSTGTQLFVTLMEVVKQSKQKR